MVTFDDVVAAAQRIAPLIAATPVIESPELNQQFGCQLFFKAEYQQRTGAFKARGASNAVLQLGEALRRNGVATHSSGNHGAALAWAAQQQGIAAQIVVPRNTSQIKLANIDRYGAEIIICEPGQANREKMLADVVAKSGAEVVHPYDDDRVIAGQGSAALELLEAVGPLDILLAPIGGGGLLAGTALVGEHFDCQIIAAEPAGADDAWRSFQSGQRQANVRADSIADGLLASIGARNWAIIKPRLSAVVRVDDAAIRRAQHCFLAATNTLIEPSSATVLASLATEPEHFSGKRVGVILTGGNVVGE